MPAPEGTWTMTRATGARAVTVLLVVAALCVSLVVALRLAHPSGPAIADDPPPPDGFFKLLPVGSYASLPSDAVAAARVHLSTWEPRPANARYNRTIPAHLKLRHRARAAHAYDPRWNTYVLNRITGHFRGTTDEIFQWAAVKWGLPDNLLRTVAYMESDWHQSNFGDFAEDRADCLPGYKNPPCPVTFGIVGTRSTSWPGIFPWNRASTAAAIDVLGGWLRGCYEGWVWWLHDHGNRSRGVYHAGDIWGCVGAWYSGNWHDGPVNRRDGENYIIRTQYWDKVRPWFRRGF
jgi:autotransporter family porin